MFSWFRNLSIRWKIELTPLCLIVVLIGTGVYFLQTLRTDQADNEALFAGPVRQAETAAELNTVVWTANANLYRLAATAATETDQEKIRTVAKETAAALGEISDSLNAAESAQGSDGRTAAGFEKLHAATAEYLKQANNAIKMADGDAGSALIFIKGAERRYDDIKKLIDNLVMASNDRRDLEIARSQMRLDTQKAMLSGILAGAALFGFLVAFLVGRSISRPLMAMCAAMHELASGNFSVRVPEDGRRDEIGGLAAALHVFKAAAIQRNQMEAEAVRNRSALDEARIAVERERIEADQRKTRELKRMVDQVELETRGAVETVVGLMGDMTQITSDMSNNADSLRMNSEAVAAAGQQTQATMQGARAATERLSSSIQKVAAQVSTTRHLSSSAVQASENTGRSIEALSHVVNEINGVTRLITDIARKTSLLAINAGVEAARSGQDGKGFAVIALEVKSLSEQTSVATGKIVELVRQVLVSTGAAVSAVGQIAQTIAGVDVAAQEMSKVVEEQVQMTRGIAANVTETAGATGAVTERMQQVATEAGTTGDLAKEVDSMCVVVAEQVRSLQASLVRIVRTCSMEVDRRQSTRHEVDFLGRLVIGRQNFEVAVFDISEGGAKVSGRFDPGANVTLHIDGMSVDLPAKVEGSSDEITRLKFDLKEHARKVLTSHLRVAQLKNERRAA